MKLYEIAITAIVSLLIITAVLVPIINSASVSEDETYSNNVSNRLLMGRDDSGSHTFSWTAGETDYTFDGETYPLNGDFPILTSTVCFLGSVTNNIPTFLCYVDYTARITSTSYDINITMGNGTITGNVGSVNVNKTYDWAYVIDPNGDHFSTFGKTNSYYITSIKDIVAYWVFCGVFDGEATFKGDEATATPILTQVGNVYSIAYDGLKVTDSNSEEHSVNAYLAPVSVTYHPTNNDDVFSLLSLVPMLLIIGVIVGIAYTFTRRVE